MRKYLLSTSALAGAALLSSAAIADLSITGTVEFEYSDSDSNIATNDKKTMASINETMKGVPGHRDYYSAASYYLTTGRDLNQAEKWINEAVKEKEYYFYYRTKAEIHAGLNKLELAVEAANKSIELAKKRGTKNLISLNERSIEEWTRR